MIEIPEGLAISPDVKVGEPWSARGAADEFENALADAQEEWELVHPEPTEEERAEREAFQAAEADATYGGTALSGYQANADAIEDARSLAVAFEHGIGEEAAAYLRYAAGKRIVIASGPGHVTDAHVVVTAVPDAMSVAAIDVVADAGSTVNLSIVVGGPDHPDVSSCHPDAPSCHSERSEESPRSGSPESPLRGDPSPSAQDDRMAARDDEATARDGRITAQDNSAGPSSSTRLGIVGTTVRVFADEGAQVNVIRTQALDDGYEDLDDMGLFAAANARIDVRQTVLGGARTFTGLAGDLRGDSAEVNVDTRYLGHGEQEHDFNYSLRHHGPKTKCNMQANGVLAGKSKKTLRGTIDLVRGCKGAQGSENETVLLVDEGVRNKTVPVILCNEDDVAGNHGATIGHIRDEQLFYLASRGLSQEAAERMFVGAVLEQAAIDAPDDASRAAVLHLGEKLSPGFAELFDD